jgi:type VI secretion system secreted protein VgrG
MPLTQENRLLALETSLGANVLGVQSVTIQEPISRLFLIEAVLSSDDGEINFDDVLGNNVTLRLQIGGEGNRFFNGICSRISQIANAGSFATYRVEVVPWLWFLTRTADCRIFQKKKTPDIIQEVFKGHGFSDFRLSLSGSYVEKEYCVQYRETDFNFVSRLMEEEGIFYFFEHENGKHTLVLADSKSALAPYPEYAELTFSELDKGDAGRECVTEWIMEKEVQPVAYTLNDHNFEKSKTSLVSSANVSRQHGGATFEIYDYPGEYLVAGEGERRAQVRLDELQSQNEVLRGQTSARGVATGCTFTLKEHTRADQNDREYLVTSVSMQIDAGSFASGGSSGEFYTCSFTCIPAAQPFRAPRLTPKPVVQGPQTAVVVGPKGEEIYVDKYGRVKVQFHWDRYGKADENSSCYIRVSQVWAGTNWGSMFTPRIGQEVVVSFEEGDPDRPIIIGSVYNDAVMPPYPLPDKKTISTTKSNSTPGGGGFNEMRMDDKKGEEQIFIHAEKNIDLRVKNNAYEWVGYDSHQIVKHDKFEKVENNRNEDVLKDHIEKIGKDRHLKIVGKEAKAVDLSLSLTVKGDVIEVFKANHSEDVTKDYYLKAQNIVIEASTNITLKVGSSSIAIEAGGIGIKTSGQLKIESTGPAEMKSSATLKLEGGATADLKSPMTTVSGDGMTTIKGGLVKIN